VTKGQLDQRLAELRASGEISTPPWSDADQARLQIDRPPPYAAIELRGDTATAISWARSRGTSRAPRRAAPVRTRGSRRTTAARAGARGSDRGDPEGEPAGGPLSAVERKDWAAWLRRCALTTDAELVEECRRANNRAALALVIGAWPIGPS
jgi:hypothetical protein